MGSETDIDLRPLETADEFRQCVAIQRLTWGDDFTELVPPSILKITQEVGGIAAGAFDPDGRLLGFVFGVSGMRDGRPSHWSDMLAVRPEARGRGLGRRLKAYQRELLLRNGIEVAYWTFDPLEARNAHLNINRLGALPIEYVPDMYGDTGSELHAGLGTDRFIVEWELAHRRVEAALRDEPADASPDPDVPIVTLAREPGARAAASDANDPAGGGLPDAGVVRVEVPRDIQSLKFGDPEAARRWRELTRRAFLHYLDSGYRIRAFQHESGTGRCFYRADRPTSPGV